MQILIVEDEAPAALRLQKMLTEVIPDGQVLQVLDSISSSVSYLKSGTTPDLILMDIHLADGLSFEIANQIEIPAPVIFTTAYDQYALQAFRANGIDYLLKPIEKTELVEAFAKFEKLTHLSTLDLKNIAKTIHQHTSIVKERFIVKSGSKMSYVPAQEIVAFLSESGSSFLITNENKRFIVDYTLDELENCVDPKYFFRVSRKHIVHVNAIGEIESHLNGRLIIKPQFKLDDELFVSRHRARDFKSWIDS